MFLPTSVTKLRGWVGSVCLDHTAPIPRAFVPELPDSLRYARVRQGLCETVVSRHLAPEDVRIPGERPRSHAIRHLHGDEPASRGLGHGCVHCPCACGRDVAMFLEPYPSKSGQLDAPLFDMDLRMVRIDVGEREGALRPFLGLELGVSEPAIEHSADGLIEVPERLLRDALRHTCEPRVGGVFQADNLLVECLPVRIFHVDGGQPVPLANLLVPRYRIVPRPTCDVRVTHEV